jgi:hypothetical protein
VRTIDSIDSSTSQPGHIFRGSLDAPVLLEGNLVVPRGLNMNLKLVKASTASGLNGSSELTVSLDSFTYQGKTYRISSSDVQQKGESRGKRSAAVIGGGAVLGAIIGGLAGGGKGAAIGAGVGGAAWNRSPGAGDIDQTERRVQGETQRRRANHVHHAREI